jgi:hypothetical protein
MLATGYSAQAQECVGAYVGQSTRSLTIDGQTIPSGRYFDICGEIDGDLILPPQGNYAPVRISADSMALLPITAFPGSVGAIINRDVTGYFVRPLFGVTTLYDVGNPKTAVPLHKGDRFVINQQRGNYYVGLIGPNAAGYAGAGVVPVDAVDIVPGQTVTPKPWVLGPPAIGTTAYNLWIAPGVARKTAVETVITTTLAIAIGGGLVGWMIWGARAGRHQRRGRVPPRGVGAVGK